jgi:Sperm-tail PG-rich repeat
MKNNQGITIGIKTTANSFMSLGDGTPGPGQYDSQKSNISRPRTAGGVIGVRTKSCSEARPSTTNNVGPGAYELENSILNEGHSRARNTGFSSQQRSSLGRGNSTPGPGAYCSLKEAYSYNSHRFGSSTR